MINYQDNCVTFDGNEQYEIAISSVLGDRDEQQDCVGYEIQDNQVLAVVCDGMGGHAAGKLASMTATEEFFAQYHSNASCGDMCSSLLASVDGVNRKIGGLVNSEGKRLQAGTTLAAIIMKDRRLMWISAGDSRIYIFREQEFVQVTKDHTYQMELDEKLQNGQVSEEEYWNQKDKFHILVSFLGVGELPYVEHTVSALEMKPDDLVILMTDGLYKLVSDTEIAQILTKKQKLNDILQAIELQAQKKAILQEKKRDNMTVAILRVK